MTLPDARTVTAYYIVGNLIVSVLFNVYQRMFNGIDATISVVLNDAAHDVPAIAGLAFAVVAHIFWPVRG